MERKKTVLGFRVTTILFLVMAGVSIIGISMVMKPFTLYNFNGIDEVSTKMLLQMYEILKSTRLIIIITLLISIIIKSFQFCRNMVD